MQKKKKRLVKLPPEVRKAFLGIRDIDKRNEYIKLLRTEGWTLASISEATGITRERVRQIYREPNHFGVTLEEQVPLPKLPLKPERKAKKKNDPSPERIARLKELQPLAQQVRSNAKRFRAEAEEYTNLLWKVYSEEGVSIYRLAKELGVTHSAIRFRLVRYGYIAPSENAKSKVYQPIAMKNRVIVAPTPEKKNFMDRISFIKVGN